MKALDPAARSSTTTTGPWARLVAAAGAVGRPPDEPPGAELSRRLLLLGGGLMSVGGLVWGTIAASLSFWIPASVPFGYVVATAANFAVLHASRDFPRARFVQVLLSLLLPFLFQWTLGGFVASGAVMLWAMIAIVGSLTFSDARHSAMWLALYSVLTVISGMVDEDVHVIAGFHQSPRAEMAFLVLNIVLVSGIVFGLAIFHEQRRKVVMAALEAEQRSNRALMDTLSEARARAEEATRVKSLVLANMSHEIRTPMNAILGLSRMVLDAPLEARQRDRIQKVHRSAQALLGIVNDILDLSKLDAGQVRLESIPFALEETLDHVVTLLGPQSEQKGLALELDVAPEVPLRLRGDPLRLGQVLVNLVGNAIKFTDRGAVGLRVGVLRREPGRVELEVRVRDTGIGMSPDLLTRLFQPFTQADASTTRRFGGTGLGLTICDRLIGAMGGNLHVQSAAGEGSTFSFIVWMEVPSEALDASHGVGAAPGGHAPTPAEAGAIEGRLAGLSVLLAEDNEINVEIAVALLERHGVRVEAVGDGAQALARVQAGGVFDAVLMDMQMPVMDGLTAARALRASGFDRPIVAMTANALAEDRVRVLEAGMNDHIAKPVEPEILYDTLARWCAGPPRGAGRSEAVAIDEEGTTRA
jgi:signal transduction histidine kinase/ActR/RegA family two-component response regulator